MKYYHFFRILREAKKLSHEDVARLAGCHRNTVINAESRRPIKFKTIAHLMAKMGYAKDSEELMSMALLWIESASGIALSQVKTLEKARAFLGRAGSGSDKDLQVLISTVVHEHLTREEIQALIFVAGNRDFFELVMKLQMLVQGKKT
jgi:transcriptional regulator with XRE-family HTH domain